MVSFHLWGLVLSLFADKERGRAQEASVTFSRFLLLWPAVYVSRETCSAWMEK